MSTPERDRVNIARAEALDAYAALERALSILFGHALGTEYRYATKIAARLLNTRARNELIQEIVDHRTAKKYREFTNSLFKRIGELDTLRNHIVHWHLSTADGRATPGAEYILRHPDIFRGSDPSVSEADMEEFRKETIYVSHAVNMLGRGLSSPPTLPDAWLDIFLQPLPYPPEPGHPLYQMHTGLGDPIWSSRP